MDTLSRLPLTTFERYSEPTQRALKLAARRAPGSAKPITAEVAAEVDQNWVMVPSKRGLQQVVVARKGDGWVAYRL